MGKSAPSPPPAPNPQAIAQAQTQSNQQTALFQSQLNNGDSFGPYGSVTNSYSPSTNQWTQQTTLSPVEQGIFHLGTRAQTGALNLANSQIGRVGDALGQSLTAPTLASGVNAGSPQTSYAGGGPITYGFEPGPGLQFGFNQGQGVQGQIGSTPLQMGLGDGPPIQLGVASGAPNQFGISAAGPIQGAVAGAGQAATSFASAGPVPGQVQGAGPV